LNDHTDILRAIADYATAYARLEELQGSSSLLPPGDQKTGCFGEFYVHLFLLRTRRRATVVRGGHSNKAWDFRVSDGTVDSCIQVKTVSGFSATRALSPIHHGWQELFVVSLDRSFRPDGFWVVPAPNIDLSTYPLKGLRAPLPGTSGRGQGVLDFSCNQFAEFVAALPPGT
jgi:hypothetical protein